MGSSRETIAVESTCPWSKQMCQYRTHDRSHQMLNGVIDGHRRLESHGSSSAFATFEGFDPTFPASEQHRQP